MKIKVGYRVKIKSLKWYETNKDAYGEVHVPCKFVGQMAQYCSKILEVSDVDGYVIRLYRDGNIDSEFVWSEQMFEKVYPPRAIRI